jgi:sugar lactone lactonase YvrE
VPDPQVLIDGLVLGESPRWHAGRLWCSDWGAHEILAVDLDGHREVRHRMTSFPFSIDWLPDGALVVVSAGDRRLLREGHDGSLEALADLRSLSDRPWNEIVVDGRGNVLLNGIGFDLMSGEEPQPGLIARLTPDGSLAVVAGDLAFPNGMAILPDGSTLVVAESYGRRLTAFDLGRDGQLSNRRIWADLGDGVPDGICVDAEGAVWYGDVPNRRCVRVQEGGEVLGAIELDRGCFACILGGPDRTTLFMMAAAWNGPGGIGAAEPTGQVVMASAPAPAAGWP